MIYHSVSFLAGLFLSIRSLVLSIIHIVEKISSTNMVKLRLLVLMRIHPAVNISRMVRYRKLVKKQKVEKPKLVEVDEEEKWKVEDFPTREWYEDV